jgi:hypothetical protein
LGRITLGVGRITLGRITLGVGRITLGVGRITLGHKILGRVVLCNASSSGSVFVIHFINSFVLCLCTTYKKRVQFLGAARLYVKKKSFLLN